MTAATKPQTSAVHLGFELGTGAPVAIPLKHMVVTGQTQEAGKTTALEALIVRSGLRAVTFVTKRGEGAFAAGRRLPPFFRERADWVFVSSLIDATLGEKNKLLRAWLMKVCRGTKTLAEVQRNVIAAKEKARGFSESIYTEIEGYLELVVPQIAQLPPARAVVIGAGLNVMDLARYSTELQALVIRSVLEHVYEHEAGVVTVIPEAWEFLPEGRGSPVKREAEALIRKGAGLKNYVWLDSQDLAGVWKMAVRAAPVVLIGVQREANEIKRTLANIPAGIAKPSASAVARLQLGEFFACWGQHTIKVYVQPAWATEEQARAVALGDHALPIRPDTIIEDTVTPEEANALQEENAELRQRIAELEHRLAAMDSLGELKEKVAGRTAGKEGARYTPGDTGGSGRGVDASPSPSPVTPIPEVLTNDDLYDAIKRRLITEAPGILKVLAASPELEITVKRETVQADGSGWLGRTALLLKEGYFKTPRKVGEAHRENLRRGANGIPARTSEAMKSLLEKGFLTLEEEGYREVAGMKVRIVEAA